MRTANEVLPGAVASKTLGDYRRTVLHALPGTKRLTLFGSRARGDARADSDYDIAVIITELPNSRQISRVLSALAYDHVLNGIFIRPIPLTEQDLVPAERRPSELAEGILRDGVEIR